MLNEDCLLPEKVAADFRQHVDNVLKNEYMGEECKERLWGKTPFGQHFVLVTTKVAWYAVRLIVDEEYRDLEIFRQRDVTTSDILEKSQHLTLERALEYRNKIHQELSNGIFPDYVSYRIRKLPPDCIDNSAFYLKPGDHIQRSLDANIPFANHEGIYIGNGKVVHINTEKSTANGISVFSEKREACARVDKIEDFVTSHDQEIRIIVHCLRRRSREDICETAQRLSDENYREGEYHFLQRNCQHFASYCALGMEWMSDKANLIEKGVIWGSAVIMGFSALYAFVKRNEPGYSEQQKKEKLQASTSHR